MSLKFINGTMCIILLLLSQNNMAMQEKKKETKSPAPLKDIAARLVVSMDHPIASPETKAGQEIRAKIPYVILQTIDQWDKKRKDALGEILEVLKAAHKRLTGKDLKIDLSELDEVSASYCLLVTCNGTKDRPSLARYFINRGADINMTKSECGSDDIDGMTPLHLAAKNGFGYTVQLLINHKDCKINDTDYEHQTPLHKAVENGWIGISRLLLAHGSTIDAQDNEENTPLHLAMNIKNPKKRLALVKLLLENNARKNIKNDDGDTPLVLAKERNYIDIIPLLASQKGKHK